MSLTTGADEQCSCFPVRVWRDREAVVVVLESLGVTSRDEPSFVGLTMDISGGPALVLVSVDSYRCRGS